MPSTNFKVFNEANDAANTYNDSEYQNATQRQTGVIPGMAISRMHNKMYFQWSTMATAIAQFLTSKGYDCMDDDIQGIQDALESVVIDDATKELYAKRDTAYSVGDTGLLIGIPAGYFLECTTAGTTATTAPTVTPPVTEGDTITDGTVVWTIRKAVCENDYSKTSFGTAVVNHLLGSTLASLVDAVSTDSLFSKMLKKALEAAGLQYSMGANGYICFGALFGNLILQWGRTACKIAAGADITYPISFTSYCIIVGAPTWGAYNLYNINAEFYSIVNNLSGNKVYLHGTKPSADPSVTVSWIAIGY